MKWIDGNGINGWVLFLSSVKLLRGMKTSLGYYHEKEAVYIQISAVDIALSNNCQCHQFFHGTYTVRSWLLSIPLLLGYGWTSTRQRSAPSTEFSLQGMSMKVSWTVTFIQLKSHLRSTIFRSKASPKKIVDVEAVLIIPKQRVVSGRVLGNLKVEQTWCQQHSL